MRHRIFLAAAALSALSLAACNNDSKTASVDAGDESMCKEVKPGTVTTVNHYCVIMNDDPVDPAVVREHKGRRVGFCCNGCIGKWNAMSDAQRDEAVRVAVAKGKPQ